MIEKEINESEPYNRLLFRAANTPPNIDRWLIALWGPGWKGAPMVFEFPVNEALTPAEALRYASNRAQVRFGE